MYTFPETILEKSQLGPRLPWMSRESATAKHSEGEREKESEPVYAMFGHSTDSLGPLPLGVLFQKHAWFAFEDEATDRARNKYSAPRGSNSHSRALLYMQMFSPSDTRLIVTETPRVTGMGWVIILSKSVASRRKIIISYCWVRMRNIALVLRSFSLLIKCVLVEQTSLSIIKLINKLIFYKVFYNIKIY